MFFLLLLQSCHAALFAAVGQLRIKFRICFHRICVIAQVGNGRTDVGRRGTVGIIAHGGDLVVEVHIHVLDARLSFKIFLDAVFAHLAFHAGLDAKRFNRLLLGMHSDGAHYAKAKKP